MENKTINIGIVTKVAVALQELNDQMVYVGGAVISLYADDAAADEVRPTSDIDMTIDLAGFAAWAAMQERLAVLGFHPDPMETVICRYKYEDIQIDIMPSEDLGMGVSNPWYKPGFEHIKKYMLADGIAIKILPVSYFIATKFAAFNDRGVDYRTSHDFEDIIYVIDNRTTIVNEIQESDNNVKAYLSEQLQTLMNNPYRDENILCHLSAIIADERLPIILGKIKQILQ